MQRVYNFSAGPATLPLEVLERAQRDLVCTERAVPELRVEQLQLLVQQAGPRESGRHNRGLHRLVQDVHGRGHHGYRPRRAAVLLSVTCVAELE